MFDSNIDRNIYSNNSISFPLVGVAGQTHVTVPLRDITTTDELIKSVATLLSVSPDRIKLGLDASVRPPNSQIKIRFGLENAKEIDAVIKSQFNSKIGNFLQQGKITRVFVGASLIT